eukprot:TRINITY_DN19343_c0_g1_i1.p1 TRINITY_DN19343_c0_g1~~TRINITY_DN19343_c0_g1_i1.p1  ORF type:complete len:344 (-),score=51.37 TRINITY_DN19343_c0_g1_i1:13-1044(-)
MSEAQQVLVGQPVTLESVGEPQYAPDIGPFFNPGMSSLPDLSDGVCDCGSDCTSCCLALWCFPCWWPWRMHVNIQRMGGMKALCLNISKRHSCMVALALALWMIFVPVVQQVLFTVPRMIDAGPLMRPQDMMLIGKCVGDPDNGCAIAGPEFSIRLMHLSVESFRPDSQVRSCEFHQEALQGCQCPTEDEQDVIKEVLELDCSDLDKSGEYFVVSLMHFMSSVLLMVFFFGVKERYKLNSNSCVACIKSFCCCQFCFILQLCRHIDRVSGHLPFMHAEARQPLIVQMGPVQVPQPQMHQPGVMLASVPVVQATVPVAQGVVLQAPLPVATIAAPSAPPPCAEP